MSELLAAKGYDVVVVARREDRLKELKDLLEQRWNVRVFVLPCDLGDPGAAGEIHDELSRQGLAVDFLVNNAGYVTFSQYVETDWDSARRYIQVLALSGAELCRRLLPHMVEQRWGRVINVASVAGLLAGTPDSVFYSASKAFVNKFTEGLAGEVGQYGVHCTAIAVGVTDTEAIDNSLSPEWAGSLFVQAAMSRPETVARESYRACMRGKRLIAPIWHNKVWAFAVVHSPPAVRYKLTEFSRRTH
jgi:hypothetical protein